MQVGSGDRAVGQMAVAVHRVNDDVVGRLDSLEDLGQHSTAAHSPHHIALDILWQAHVVRSTHHFDRELELAAVDTRVATASIGEVGLDAEHLLAD